MKDYFTLHTETRQILVRTTRGEERLVEAACLHIYAVHRQLFGDGWAITHISSRLLVWKTRSDVEAFKALYWLEQHSPMPAQATERELREWSEENMTRWLQMKEQLGIVAPLWPPVLPVDLPPV